MSSSEPKSSNCLIHEKSPYLLQHAHNPVDWHPWGGEAFEKARRENKPIFLSIGYSTCHWCHVMERESFENEAIAKIMNEQFVNIKVDREERPDVDQIYMTAVQALTGSGGWPLSAFLNHDLEPFFGGTYFPPDRRWGRPGFNEVLLEISRIWRDERAKADEAGRDIAQFLRQQREPGPGGVVSPELLKKALQTFQSIFDARDGGFGPAPKFPRSETISLLFRIGKRFGDESAFQMAEKTLSAMARGGIYDHTGGGFHRYSTDARWLVPHFEKMLYDNALLAKSYLEAFQVDGNPMWAEVARETLDYVLRDMTSLKPGEGGFYSAEDADSEGVEGKFYIWSEDELKQVLTADEFQKVKETFQTSPQGNFEHANILHMKPDTPWSARYQEPLASALKKLHQVRSRRIPPYKDDKVIASWNGLMVSAMAFGAQVLEEGRYRKAAQKAADFILTKLWDGKTLHRRYRDGDVRFDGSLDDYAFVIQGLLDLCETDFDPRWFQAALDLQKRSDELFWDERDGGYFFTVATDKHLLARTKEIYDGAVPSGNSVAALNLLKFYSFTSEDGYRQKFEKLSRIFAGFLDKAPHGAPAFLMAVDYATDDPKEIVVAGSHEDPRTQMILQGLRARFLPNKVVGLADPADAKSSAVIPLLQGKVQQDNRPTLYVCRNHACQRPVHSLEEAMPEISPASPESSRR